MDFEGRPESSPPPPDVGPAVQAAMRQGAASRRHALSERAYPATFEAGDPTGDAVALAATRALLTVSTRLQAAQVLTTAISDLGGCVIPARLASETAISVDVSLGIGEPRVVLVLDPVDLASMRLVRHLPALVEDSLAAAARADHHARQSRRASTDALTGVGSRGEIGLRLGLTSPGDLVCMVDLDGLKEINDSNGHDAGDEVLRNFGAALRASIREGDFVGRYGGDEFVVILTASPVAVVIERLGALSASWTVQMDGRTSVSMGLSVVGDEGPMTALRAADTALYRAKRSGGGRVEIATGQDYLEFGPASS